MRTRSSGPEYLLYLSVKKYKTFNFEKAICNHGFFMMAPNRWNPLIKSLQRPLRIMGQCKSVMVTIFHPYGGTNLHIYVHDMKVLSLEDQQSILTQVSRMLRITDEDEKRVIEFQKLHPIAKEEGFGRIFRSPSIFEDAVKSLLLCCCKWSQSLEMAKSLCELQLLFSSSTSKKQLGNIKLQNNGMGNFPNSKELLEIGETNLKKHCKLGMRAGYIMKLAQKVEENSTLEKFEDQNSWFVHSRLSKFTGFGPFTIATTLMCMGRYEKVPVDSETRRHLQEVYGISACKSKSLDKIVEEIYSKYAPFQCIAYWFELKQSYEKSYGRLSDLDESKYYTITAVPSNKRKFDSE